MERRWGLHMAGPKGYIAELGKDVYNHRFGGQSWHVLDKDKVFSGPVLLLTLDLTDPRLASVYMEGCPELPLSSYIDCSIYTGKQIFRILPEAKQIVLIYRDIKDPELYFPPDMMPTPLPKKPIRLRAMRPDEYPIDADTYDKAFDEFTGPAFIRVLGPPLWMDHVSEICTCGLPAEYIASIGYEIEPSGFLDNEPFMIGETYLYFLFCRQCREYIVVSQGT